MHIVSSRTYPSAIAAARLTLRALIGLNLLLGAFIMGLLIASVVAEGPVMAALGARRVGDDSMLFGGMRLIMIIGICSVPLAHTLLKRLLAIVDSIRVANPFLVENAARLQTIAWALLAIELLHIAAGIVAASVSSEAAPLDINWTFSVMGWVAVLLLFVLAHVFDHGARMRLDLEGTV